MKYTYKQLVKMNKLLEEQNNALMNALENTDELAKLQGEQIKHYEDLVGILQS